MTLKDMDIINAIWILILIVFGIFALLGLARSALDWLLDNEIVFAILIQVILIAAGVVLGLLIFRGCF